jgi:hypothetical protein
MHMISCRGKGLILDVCINFYNTFIGICPWNSMWTFHGIHMDYSMESLWNSTWICHLCLVEIPWIPHGPVHGLHMECTIPWAFHMDSIMGVE